MSNEDMACFFCGRGGVRVMVVDEVTDPGCDIANVPIYAASCPYCGARGPMALSEGEAVEAWDRRAERTDDGGRMSKELKPCPLCGSTDIACFAEEHGDDYDNVPTFRAVVGCRGCHEEDCDPSYDDEPCFGIEVYFRADHPLVRDCEDPSDCERVLERHMAEKWNRRAERTCWTGIRSASCAAWSRAARWRFVMPTDTERRKVARRLRELDDSELQVYDMTYYAIQQAVSDEAPYLEGREMCDRLADLIAPSYKPSAEYEAWYEGLSHFGDGRGGPSTIRELIEEIVWAALTVDLGPNGNTDLSTGIDEGDVYTDKLFAEWEREVLSLSVDIDRDALLALADEMEEFGGLPIRHPGVRVLQSEDFSRELGYARRIREALGVQDA